jgi:hypothetical protein
MYNDKPGFSMELSESPPSLSVLNVGDIPILMELLKQSGMVELLDGHFSVHGNWEGSSVGEVVLVWLSYIIDLPSRLG